jgi:acetyl esterase/lipase
MRFLQEKITVKGQTALLYAYLLDHSEDIKIDKRPMVLICPGGAYEFTSDREAEPIAMKFLAEGLHACILRYTVAPARFPTALAQAAKAVALIRENAAGWRVDPEKITVMGFSAGGHLAASLGVFWDSGFLVYETGLAPNRMKPDKLILCYPVITSGEHCHAGSFEALLGEDAQKPESRAFVSLETRVTPKTPPAFIWHTWADDAVPVENSLLFMEAMRKNGVPFEAHIYPNGEHGLSLGTALTESASEPGGRLAPPEVTGWIDMAARWVTRQ